MQSKSLKIKVTKSTHRCRRQLNSYTCLHNHYKYAFSWYSEKAVAKNIYIPKIKQINKDSNFNTDFLRITAVSEELVVFRDWMELSIGDYKLLLLTKRGWSFIHSTQNKNKGTRGGFTCLEQNRSCLLCDFLKNFPLKLFCLLNFHLQNKKSCLHKWQLSATLKSGGLGCSSYLYLSSGSNNGGCCFFWFLF